MNKGKVIAGTLIGIGGLVVGTGAFLLTKKSNEPKPEEPKETPETNEEAAK